MDDETNPEVIQGTPFKAYVGSYFQVMEDDCVGHPSLAKLELSHGARFGANSRTTQRQYWLFNHFSSFQRARNGHEGSYFVNCVYWDDLGVDENGKILPTTCLVIGPFFIDDEESKKHGMEVKEELEKYNLWRDKTHLRVLGRGW